jgi:hypothetical protein
MGELSPLPSTPLPLFLHLQIQVPRETNLLRGYVVADFLTPLFGGRWLNGSRFSLVSGTKGTGEASRISIGVATPAEPKRGNPGWSHCHTTPDAAPASQPWIEQLRRSLAASVTVPLPEAPVHLQVTFRCAPDRNWVSLWRAAGQALGPVLAYDQSRNPYHPREDRVTHLEFHRQTDDRLGSAVEVDYSWTAAAGD